MVISDLYNKNIWCWLSYNSSYDKIGMEHTDNKVCYLSPRYLLEDNKLTPISEELFPNLGSIQVKIISSETAKDFIKTRTPFVQCKMVMPPSENQMASNYYSFRYSSRNEIKRSIFIERCSNKLFYEVVELTHTNIDDLVKNKTIYSSFIQKHPDYTDPFLSKLILIKINNNLYGPFEWKEQQNEIKIDGAEQFDFIIGKYDLDTYQSKIHKMHNIPYQENNFQFIFVAELAEPKNCQITYDLSSNDYLISLMLEQAKINFKLNRSTYRDVKDYFFKILSEPNCQPFSPQRFKRLKEICENRKIAEQKFFDFTKNIFEDDTLANYIVNNIVNKNFTAVKDHLPSYFTKSLRSELINKMLDLNATNVDPDNTDPLLEKVNSLIKKLDQDYHIKINNNFEIQELKKPLSAALTPNKANKEEKVNNPEPTVEQIKAEHNKHLENFILHTKKQFQLVINRFKHPIDNLKNHFNKIIEAYDTYQTYGANSPQFTNRLKEQLQLNNILKVIQDGYAFKGSYDLLLKSLDNADKQLNKLTKNESTGKATIYNEQTEQLKTNAESLLKVLYKINNIYNEILDNKLNNTIAINNFYMSNNTNLETLPQNKDFKSAVDHKDNLNPSELELKNENQNLIKENISLKNDLAKYQTEFNANKSLTEINQEIAKQQEQLNKINKQIRQAEKKYSTYEQLIDVINDDYLDQKTVIKKSIDFALLSDILKFTQQTANRNKVIQNQKHTVSNVDNFEQLLAIPVEPTKVDNTEDQTIAIEEENKPEIQYVNTLEVPQTIISKPITVVSQPVYQSAPVQEKVVNQDPVFDSDLLVNDWIYDTSYHIIKQVSDYIQIKAGRNISHNDITNILICISQGFITTFAGEPGTGKTTLCNLVANALGLIRNDESNRYTEVAVERGWTSLQDFVGYFNPLTNRMEKSNANVFNALEELHFEALYNQKHPEQPKKFAPYFILLDEANLSPIEHYWATFFKNCDNNSVSNRCINLGGENKFQIPEQLRFLATVNFDHTTEELSPRFLDRSWIITLDPIDEYDDLNYCNEYELEGGPIISYEAMIKAFSPNKTDKLSEKLVNKWNKIRDIFSSPECAMPLSPRNIKMVMNYCHTAERCMDYHPTILSALDYAVAQKVLPAINGTGDRYKTLVNKLVKECNEETMPLSAKHLARILNNGGEDIGYYRFFSR